MTEPLNPVALAERVIALFAEAKFGATYKHAVMLGLMDLAFEKTSHTGVAPSSVLVASIRWPTRWSATCMCTASEYAVQGNLRYQGSAETRAADTIARASRDLYEQKPP